MKNLNKFCVGLSLLAAITACKENTTEPKISSDTYVSAELLPESVDSNNIYVITEEAVNNVDSVFSTFMWTPSDYSGVNLQRNYVLELSNTEDFAVTQALGATAADETQVNYATMNNAVLALGLSAGNAHKVYSRVVTTVTPNVDTLYSSNLAFTVNPVFIAIDYPKVYMPGDFSGWNNNDLKYTLASLNFDGNYEGYMPLTLKEDGTTANGEFKFVTIGGDWESQYGLTSAGLPADNPVDLISKAANGGDPGNCNIPTGISTAAKQYRVEATIFDGADEGSYTITPVAWGVIGDATGSWDADQDMSYVRASNTWTIDIDLVVGEMKFRANDDWGINFGQGDTGDNSLKFNAGNIKVTEAGNYTVTMDLSTAPNWTYTLQKN
ncbi:SusE domain-containing protein [Flammeovirga kamogawensis]|uniref:SusE domain-containing protein n=1 Tax=Flammeovirga kamogawensis TaxID=373891 RepID=A0ABX8GY32_9BACT|nr:SusE domain-containing protein [Flammeovirga kamogawensis]MBB6462891.1 hypothetical protein [Flammeovirga kamogawensis]QWG08329.1 SusE domain-containing protein [Flammeovirga kamogawensis]TRX66624.1 SusF/SusE family outer membrane protein [Flammeovirga kamogawensis]